MPIFTVHYKSEYNNWAKIEADSAEQAMEYVKSGGKLDDIDSDESTRRYWGFRVDEGSTGQGNVTKVN